MAKVSEGIAPGLARWIERQPVFFVGTAPLAGDGHVNVSPKGTRGTFKVLDQRTFAYVDLGLVGDGGGGQDTQAAPPSTTAAARPPLDPRAGGRIERAPGLAPAADRAGAATPCDG